MKCLVLYSETAIQSDYLDSITLEGCTGLLQLTQSNESDIFSQLTLDSASLNLVISNGHSETADVSFVKVQSKEELEFYLEKSKDCLLCYVQKATRSSLAKEYKFEQSKSYKNNAKQNLKDSFLLVLYYCPNITRKDLVTRFDEDMIFDRCGNGTIATNQFLSEIAFKLGKTNKYGA